MNSNRHVRTWSWDWNIYHSIQCGTFFHPNVWNIIYVSIFAVERESVSWMQGFHSLGPLSIALEEREGCCSPVPTKHRQQDPHRRTGLQAHCPACRRKPYFRCSSCVPSLLRDARPPFLLLGSAHAQFSFSMKKSTVQQSYQIRTGCSYTAVVNLVRPSTEQDDAPAPDYPKTALGHSPVMVSVDALCCWRSISISLVHRGVISTLTRPFSIRPRFHCEAWLLYLVLQSSRRLSRRLFICFLPDVLACCFISSKRLFISCFISRNNYIIAFISTILGYSWGTGS